jgi:hypothetical protein
MTPRLPLLLSAVLLASGCSVTTQLGAECVLVRKPTAEELKQNAELKSVPIKESELVAGQDFISFGVLDCDELEFTCVRDANHPSSASGTETAKGYCSQACVLNTSACEVLGEEVAEGVKDRKMTCRSLVLDPETLEALKRADEKAYRQTFGENSSAFFCVAALSAAPKP